MVQGGNPSQLARRLPRVYLYLKEGLTLPDEIYDDLRGYIEGLESANELINVEREVDWDEEIGAISRRVIDLKERAPLFQKIKDYPDGYRVFCNPIGPTKPLVHGRLAIALGLKKESSVREIIAYLREAFGREPIPPKLVSTGPCKENKLIGEDVDLFRFPSPVIHSIDGGRYLGTWHTDITKDPDSDWVNWGMYRHQVLGKNKLGWLALPGQHGPSIYYQKYEKRGEPMPMAIAIGTDPISSIVSCSQLPAGVNEAGVVGAFRQRPVELVKCETIDIDVPANSEIVLEGYVYPNERELEGPFCEYTGYRAGGEELRPVFHCTCITYRNNPILTVSNMGKPWDDYGVLVTATMSALISNGLKQKGIPFKEVYVPAGSVGVIVSANQVYPGFAQTIASAIWSIKSGIYRPYIIVVGEDVNVTDPEEVLWCLTTRLHPSNGIHIYQNSPSQALIPYINGEERKNNLSSRVLLDATFPAEWPKEEVPTVVDFENAWSEEIRKKVLTNWTEYGFS